ncbi:MAG: hypothetical protein WAU68_14440 [Vitreimonas sp.]
MSEHNDWSQRRRDRHLTPTASDAALSLCARHLQSGALTNAGRAALLAQRLMHLEATHSERRRKQDMVRQRAETALEQARKAVDSPGGPPKPRYEPLTNGQWRTMLERSIAAANTPRLTENAAINSAPVQIPQPDSC